MFKNRGASVAKARKAVANFPQAQRLKTLGLKLGRPGTPQAQASWLHTDDERIGALLQAIGVKPE